MRPTREFFTHEYGKTPLPVKGCTIMYNCIYFWNIFYVYFCIFLHNYLIQLLRKYNTSFSGSKVFKLDTVIRKTQFKADVIFLMMTSFQLVITNFSLLDMRTRTLTEQDYARTVWTTPWRWTRTSWPPPPPPTTSWITCSYAEFVGQSCRYTRGVETTWR